MTFWDTVERGEYVMIALAVIFIAIVLIWWIRGAKLHGFSKSYSPLMHRVRDHISEGDIENARQICGASSSPGARVVQAGVDHIGKTMAEVRSAMSQSASLEKESLLNGVVWLRCFAIVSPLLGLGGTLVGVIDRLRDIAEQGAAADVATIAGAIAPTIVTTVAGLGVGIFALVALSALQSSVASARLDIERLAAQFSALLENPST